MQFCFGDFELFAMLLAYISLGASNFVLVSHFLNIFLSASYLCLGCQFLAHSVFYTTLFVNFLCLIAGFLIIHVFCMYSAVSETESSLKGILCCICSLSVKSTSYWQYVVTIPHVLCGGLHLML